MTFNINASEKTIIKGKQMSKVMKVVVNSY